MEEGRRSGVKWNLKKLSSGERVALKRAAGSLEYNAPALRAYYRAIENAPVSWQIAYAAMCMACLWKEENIGRILPMEECLRLLVEDEAAGDSMAHRIEGMMELNWSEDGFLLGKLLNLVRIIQSRHPEVYPDFMKLADDLNRWNKDDHVVQRRWLWVIFAQRKDEEKESEGGTQS